MILTHSDVTQREYGPERTQWTSKPLTCGFSGPASSRTGPCLVPLSPKGPALSRSDVFAGQRPLTLRDESRISRVCDAP
jgi:hypothetical protein